MVPPWSEEKRLLAISAHPDDVEFTSGGSLARWVSEGWVVSLIVCTDGGKGSHDPSVVPAELATIRQAEQRTAANVLGISDLVFLGYPDGELARASDLVERFARHIRRQRPDRLLSWDPWKPYQLHPDHRAAGLAALDAVLAAGNPHYFPHQLVNGLSPHQVAEVYLYGAAAPDTWVDIAATFAQKMTAIEAHHSQVGHLRGLAERMSHCNREYARHGQNGVTYAEAFKVLHPFCDT
jgi:LmbE family N-acetylglucosaminyl deacetylase